MMYNAFVSETNIDLKSIFETEKVGNPISDIADSYFIQKVGYENSIKSFNEHPDGLFGDLRELDLDELILIPPNEWLKDRMNEFNYWESFDKHGMVYPITVSPHTEEWVQERLQRGKTPQHIRRW